MRYKRVNHIDPHGLCAFLIAIFVMGSVGAQDISEYYSVQHADEFELDYKNDLYIKANQLTAKVRAKNRHKLDVPYGPDPKQRLDIYFPEKPFEKAPVLIFLHGGSLSEGDKSHYGFTSSPYAAQGIITVASGYRLVTAGFRYPSQLDDVKSAIAWVYTNIAEHGGDPDSIFIVGHSAGAMLAASATVDVSWLKGFGIPPTILKGVVLVSGRYDLTVIEDADYDKYVPTPELKLQASPLQHVSNPVPAALIAAGSLEEIYVGPSWLLNDVLLKNGVDSKFLELRDANHIDTVLCIGMEGSVLADGILEMIRSN